MDEMETIPISLVAQWAFCPRRAWLEAVGETVDDYCMQVGFGAHRGVDDPATARRGEMRAVALCSAELGITGKADSLRPEGAGYEIVEYKATPVKADCTPTRAMRLQLALQAICLFEMGLHVVGARVYYPTRRRYATVELDEELLAEARAAVAQTRETVLSDKAPAPLEDDRRCDGCSHVGICLPDERKLGPVSRKIRAADPDGRILHLATPGSRASISKGTVVVSRKGEKLVEVPVETVQALVVHGNVDVSGALIRELLWRNAPIAWCTSYGKLAGWAQSSFGPNGFQRVEQHVASREGRIDLAREFVSAKICNQTTQLRRAGAPADTVERMRSLQHEAESVLRVPDLFGVEGEAAALYFGSWGLLIKERKRSEWSWEKRAGHPAADEVNALLDYAYALLRFDAIRAIIACGLDPHAGFLHSSRRNKPAFALDLMEEFRAPVADSVVQQVINNGEVSPSGFSRIEGRVAMLDVTRKKLIAAYERRMESRFRHPVFEYEVSWRRALEIQARQILGVLDGTQAEYRGIRTR